MGKSPPASAGSNPGAGRPPGGGHGHPLQSSCLENPTDRGAWRATVYGVTQTDSTRIPLLLGEGRRDWRKDEKEGRKAQRERGKEAG